MFSDSRSRILRTRLALSEFRQTFRATRCSHAATVGRERRLSAFFHSTTKTAWAASSASASWASIRRHSLKTMGPWRRTSSSNAVSEELSTTTANNCPSCRGSNALTSVRTACDGLFAHSIRLCGEVLNFSKKSRNPSAGHGTFRPTSSGSSVRTVNYVKITDRYPPPFAPPWCWNVFVALAGLNGLASAFKILTAVEVEPELYLWGIKISDE
jgi:hypothetical protein